MNQGQMALLVEEIVACKIAENQEMVTRGLSANLDWDDGWEQTVSRAVTNAVRVSTQLSIQITLDLLLQTGLFHLSPDAVQPDLVLLRGGKNPESSDETPQL